MKKISKNKERYRVINVKKIDYPEDFIIIEMPSFKEVKRLFTRATIYRTSTHSLILDTQFGMIFIWENDKK